MQKRGILFVIVFILLSCSVYAIGISPERADLTFTPNLEQDYTVYILNSAERPINATVSFSGDLAQYVRHEPQDFIIPKESSYPYAFTLDLPSFIKKPGKHTIKIIANELPFGDIKGITVLTSVSGRLLVFVPYTGKYAELALQAHDVNEGEPITLTIIMRNLAKLHINTAQATIEIVNEEQELVKTIRTDTHYLPALNSVRISHILDSTLFSPGTYTATGTLIYDDDFSEPATTTFRIGTLFVAVLDYTKIFQYHAVTPFTIDVANKWNSPITNLYATIRILDKGTPVGPVLTTPSADLAPWGTTQLTTYWDTEGLQAGAYTAEITLHYHDRTTTTRGSVTITKPFALDTMTVLVIIIITILLIDLAIWAVHRRKRDDEDD